VSDVAIRVQGIGKRYRLGDRVEPRYKTLRDTVSGGFGLLRHRARARHEFMWALRNVDFDIPAGEVVGIIGRNGSGKSTLLKILSRITEPTEGAAQIHGRVGSLLEVGTGFHPELTGRENIFLNGAILGMKKAEIARNFDEIVAFAEVEQFIDTAVKHYSSGMYLRLAFAVAAHLEPEILLVDEVLAVGDAAFQKKCMCKMDDVARAGRTVLFVSHNMGAVSHLCERGIVLERGRVGFIGSASDAVQIYNHSMAQATSSDAPHVLYAEPHSGGTDFAVTRIETLDESGRPKPVVSTWDDVVLRVWFSAKTRLQRGSVVLEINAFDGSRLLLLSTQPDANIPVSFDVGEDYVDCVLPQLPLAAGDYLIGAGLAVPGTEWLWRRESLGTLSVAPSDVYGSGLAPHAGRCLMAVPHRWALSHKHAEEAVR
jgi:lipopolysaccharide transport system ATP-binding protein